MTESSRRKSAPPTPFFRLTQLSHVQLGHILRRETAVGAQAAVVVHGEDELDGVSEGEDNALEAEGVADVLNAELRILGEDGGADGLRHDALLGLLTALRAHDAPASDER